MSTAVRTRRLDAAASLDGDAKLAALLADALSSGDLREFQQVLQAAARAHGMAAIAEASGLGRESLYKALRPDAQPRFDTVRRVIEALGLTLSFTAIATPVRANAVHESRSRYDVGARKPAKATAGKPASTGAATRSRKPVAKPAVARKSPATQPMAKATLKKGQRPAKRPVRKKAAKR